MKVKDRSLLEARELDTFCERNGIPVRAFYASAFALAIKSYTAAEEAVFTCRDQGKKAGLRLACDPKETILSEIKRCEELLFEAFENDKNSHEDNTEPGSLFDRFTCGPEQLLGIAFGVGDPAEDHHQVRLRYSI